MKKYIKHNKISDIDIIKQSILKCIDINKLSLNIEDGMRYYVRWDSWIKENNIVTFDDLYKYISDNVLKIKKETIGDDDE